MKTGFIAPIPHLGEFAHGGFHLILSHLLSDSTYRDHYRCESDQGAFVVLDNSAHEQSFGNAPEVLIEQAIDIGARELVCPDELFSARGTADRTRAALKMYSQNFSKELTDHKIQLMVVPQAKTPMEWGECLHELTLLFRLNFPGQKFTVGISKDYEKWRGGLPYLIRRYVEPLRQRFQFDVHMLGWVRKSTQLSECARLFPWIRSVDSAKPFVFALDYQALTSTLVDNPYPGRPKDYFQVEMNEVQRDIARWNCSVFRRYANDRVETPWQLSI